MKNIIFINSRQIEYYDFEELKKLGNFKFQLITDSLYFKKLSDNQKKFFHKIHILKQNRYEHTTIKPFTFAEIESIVQKELIEDPNLEIICSEEINILETDLLKRKLNIYDSTEVYIDAFRNKILMKKKAQAAGIRTPKFMNIEQEKLKLIPDYLYEEIVNFLGTPFVIKPTDQHSSIGVFKITNFRDFSRAYWSMLGNNYEAEELIEGDLYHSDVLIQDGLIHFNQASRYMFSGLDFLKGHNHGSIPILASNPLSKRMRNFTEKVLKALGMKSGSAHLELFHTPSDELIFLEIGARPPGSLVVENYRRSLGINILNEDFKIKMGIPLNITAHQNIKSFWGFFPRIPGRVLDLIPPILHSPYDIRWFIQKGDVLTAPEAISHKAAEFFVYNPNYDTLLRDFEELRFHRALSVEPVDDFHSEAA